MRNPPSNTTPTNKEVTQVSPSISGRQGEKPARCSAPMGSSREADIRANIVEATSPENVEALYDIQPMQGNTSTVVGAGLQGTSDPMSPTEDSWSATSLHTQLPPVAPLPAPPDATFSSLSSSMRHSVEQQSFMGSESRSASSRPIFQVLPASQPLPHQTVQTPSQVQSILSLPTPLLLHLARTVDHKEQKLIARQARATPYLSSMALPPPSPSHLVTSFVGQSTTVTSIGDHPAIPILLGQVFCPPTPGIVAPTNFVTPRFQPTYASVEDWSVRAAREQVQMSKLRGQAKMTGGSGLQRPAMVMSHSFNEREIRSLAEQMKHWALREQEKQVHHQVASSMETAVVLSAQAAARSAIVQAASQTVNASVAPRNGDVYQKIPSQVEVALASAVMSGGAAGLDETVQTMDLSAYATSYKAQLDALASGYFSQLHRDALRRLLSPSSPDLSSSNLGQSIGGSLAASRRPSVDAEGNIEGTPQAQAMHVQAAAAAAVAANAMAANEMASVAGSALVDMGVDLPRLMPSNLPAGPAFGLATLRVTPESIAVPSRRGSDSSVGGSTSQPQSRVSSGTPLTSSAPADVQAMIARATEIHDCTPEKRDYLLAYAHTVYLREPSNNDLLALLHTLESIHPNHLPTLLLMSCVYYTRNELEGSLHYNEKLLKYDPNYVEAMSNIGTTLRAMGKWQEAEKWWWRAIHLRPTYWDATENLLGVLCNPSPSSPNTTSIPNPLAVSSPEHPRYDEALALCDYVETNMYRSQNTPRSSQTNLVDYGTGSRVAKPSGLARPRRLPALVATTHIHRLQNLFYAKGNLQLALGNPAKAQDEYEKAVEIALSLPSWASDQGNQTSYPIEGCTTRDLVTAATVIGKVLAAYAQTGGDLSDGHVYQVVQELGLGEQGVSFNFDQILRMVRDGGDSFVARMMQIGGGSWPTVLLEPGQLTQLARMLFQSTNGTLPALLETGKSTPPSESRQQSTLSTNQTTSTMLLTLAKVFQDAMGQAADATNAVSLGGLPPSPALLLPLYYVALAIYPSPSTCNNLGILLSTLNATTLVASGQPNVAPYVCTGQQLALKYYNTGLRLDPKHPHLYTNLGSLLKDMGQLPQAVAMYKKAVEFNPNFDVALANLANAIKDTGKIQESIQYYRRAVDINPGFPEAICGLVNALGGICDWTGRGSVGESFIVDDTGLLAPAPPLKNGEMVVKSGYMGTISMLIGKQLEEGSSYGKGSLKSCGSMRDWLLMINQAITGLTSEPSEDFVRTWSPRLSPFLEDPQATTFNEGGYLIRLIERLMRRTQRMWYLANSGNHPSSPNRNALNQSPQSDLFQYRRIILPPSLPLPPVTTILPFHCFTYPVTAREERLISHRTGLRISHSTLNQPWLPQCVYPPPLPPQDGKVKVGYVSSDLGNHPLSHLMQSVFGFHDLTKFSVFCYATSASDQSPYRLKIESEVQNFVDVSSFSTQEIVERIVKDGIHILVNLSGYTKGARNEIFAARPAPVQVSYMGFAGTLAAGWSDYFIVDPIVCPPQLASGSHWRNREKAKTSPTSSPSILLDQSSTDFEGDPDPESISDEFVYTEKLIYLPHSYFVTDHKQSWREDPRKGSLASDAPLSIHLSDDERWAVEEDCRWQMRKQLFPTIREDTFIFANWNQLYKIDPFIYKIWLNILAKHPNSILWLLRFPSQGEAYLKETATKWAGPEVAARVIFTDVANKNDHIHRGRVADLFLDTTECNAHTTAADILWSGTPILTFPRYLHKMCSRVAASIALATGYGESMIVRSGEEYERRALELSLRLRYVIVPPPPSPPPTPIKNDDQERHLHQKPSSNQVQGRQQRRGQGELSDLRRKLFLTREDSPLFDTKRWVRNMEQGYREAWNRWVDGSEFEENAVTASSQHGSSHNHHNGHNINNKNHIHNHHNSNKDSTYPGQGRQDGCIWIEDHKDGRNEASRSPFFV